MRSGAERNLEPDEEKEPTRSVGATVLGVLELGLGLMFLYWQFTVGIYDESSLGTMYFLWGSVAALFGLVLPGAALLFKTRMLWGCQVAPALLVLWILWIYLGRR